MWKQRQYGCMILYYEPDGRANAVRPVLRVRSSSQPSRVISWTALADELWSKVRPPPLCTGAILNHSRVERYTTPQSISSQRSVPALSPPMSNPTQANPCVGPKHHFPTTISPSLHPRLVKVNKIATDTEVWAKDACPYREPYQARINACPSIRA